MEETARPAGHPPRPRFCDVGVAIDHLKVRQAPKIEQLGPRLVSVFAPDTEQWGAMVNFGIFP